MYALVIPFAVLIAIVVFKKIPYIGGKTPYALLIAAVLVVALSGHIAPSYWGGAIVEGLTRMGWVICLCIFVNFYSQTQMRLGTIDAVVCMLRSLFGGSQKALLLTTMLALIFSGAFTGSTMACTTIVGMLVARSLYDCGLSAEKTTATVVIGAMLGSLMPPISSSFFGSSAISGVDVGVVLNEGYKVIGISVLVAILYVVFILGGKQREGFAFDNKREKIGDIWRECRVRMIPMFLLIMIIILKQCFDINVMAMTVGKLISPLNNVPVVKSIISNYLVLAFLVVGFVGFIYPEVHKDAKGVFKGAYKTSTYIVPVMFAAACLVGAVVTTGGLDMVSEAASKLNPHVLIIGGAVAMCAMGMITGGDSSALNTIFPFFFPAVTAIGVPALNATMAGSLITVAGQAFPPCDTLVFMACGVLSGVLGVKKIDPMKVMILDLPIGIFLTAFGMFYLYVY